MTINSSSVTNWQYNHIHYICGALESSRNKEYSTCEHSYIIFFFRVSGYCFLLETILFTTPIETKNWSKKDNVKNRKPPSLRRMRREEIGIVQGWFHDGTFPQHLIKKGKDQHRIHTASINTTSCAEASRNSPNRELGYIEIQNIN